MNLKSFLSFTILILMIIISSCEQNEPEFSCDPEINSNVKENKKAFSTIPLDELNTYDISLQRAIFISWDSTKKRNAWLEKLNQVIINEEMDSSEIKHLRELSNHISTDYFSDENIKNRPAGYSEFAEEWVYFALNDLLRTERYIAFIVYRLYTTQEQFDEELSEINDLQNTITIDTEIYDCSCNTSSDFCNTGICNSGDCNITEGCGWLWSLECNGLCF